MTIGELIAMDTNIIGILMGAGCTASAALLHRVSPWKKQLWFHGLDAQVLEDQINDYLAAKISQISA